jgi:hypothetical protein
LLTRVKAGVAPNTPDFRALTELMLRCRQAVTFGKQFVANIAADHPELSDEQRRCLQNAFGSLAPADLDALLGAGLSPDGSEAPRGVAVMNELLSGCGVG